MRIIIKPPTPSLRPYYQRECITIYHGNCLKIAPLLRTHISCIITDPPYGIGYKQNNCSIGTYSNRAFRHIYDDAISGDKVDFDPYWIVASGKPACQWGAIH